MFYSIPSIHKRSRLTNLQIEKGIATQRLRLFRLLAGLSITVAFAVAVPFSCECRRWIRRTVLSILSRAERAVHKHPAQLIAVLNGLSEEPLWSKDDLPSLTALHARIKALCTLLDDLPRQGLRLLRPIIGPRSGRTGWGHSRGVAFRQSRFHAWRLGGVRIERPPDKKPDAVFAVA